MITTITTSIITTICVSSSNRNSTTTTITVAMVGIKIEFIVVRTSTRVNAANTTISTYLHSFANILLVLLVLLS